MTRKQCTCCIKVKCGTFINEPEKYKKNWHCGHYKKPIKDIKVCREQFMFTAPSCCDALMDNKIKKDGVLYKCGSCKKIVFKTLDTFKLLKEYLL